MTTAPRITYRAATFDDIEAIVALANLVDIPYFGEAPHSVEETQNEWTQSEFDVNQHTQVAINDSAVIVGVSECRIRSPFVQTYVWLRVHPDYEGLGIETHLLQWGEQMARHAMEKAPADALIRMRTSAVSKNTTTKALFEAYGLVHDLTFWRMRIDFDQSYNPYVPPTGITIRAINPATEAERAIFVIDDAFRDHRNHVDRPFDKVYQAWRHWLFDNPNYDLRGFLVAAIDGEIVGGAVCSDHPHDPNLGFVDELGVLKSHRGRGVGMALLKSAFDYFRQRGKTSVELGVDASSLTGAQHLYQNAGMIVKLEFYMYGKVLRDGTSYTVD